MGGGLHENMQRWSSQEDIVIRKWVLKLGKQWNKIANFLPGRTVSSIRNRHQRLVKGDLMRSQGIQSRNKCRTCGMSIRGHTCLVDIVSPERGDEKDEEEDSNSGSRQSSSPAPTPSTFDGDATSSEKWLSDEDLLTEADLEFDWLQWMPEVSPPLLPLDPEPWSHEIQIDGL